MKVIFLDFDGVLNSEKYIKASNKYGVVIDPSRMVLLKKIVENTNAEIVLSTSWREHWDKDTANCNQTGIEINEIFGEYGLEIFDKTPKLNLKREDEIKAWLNENKVENFIVLDDAFLSSNFLDGHFIKTSNYFNGLDETDVEKAIEILNN